MTTKERTGAPSDAKGEAPDAAEVPQAVFDAEFYRALLPSRVETACQGDSQGVPVVKLQLADGGVLDLCHIAQLHAMWFAAYYYRDIRTCEDMELAFVPYSMVSLVTVSLESPANRKVGFNVRQHGESVIPLHPGTDI